MVATVPTADEFAALEARVAALEAGTEPIPPDPGPEPPEPIAEGVQAKRIAHLIESFGVNTFSSLDTNNLWGSWPADYRPQTVIAALQYILGESGFAFRLREYHYSGRETMQRQWLTEVTAGIPGTRVALCVAANGATNDVPTMLLLAEDPACNVVWVEGLNEPNTDFGSGTIPIETTMAIQTAIDDQAPECVVMGPSIVAGTPHPEGWVTGYAGDSLPALNALMEWGNGHYYPPHSPDVPGTGYSINDYVGGLWTAYDEHAIALTEFHPTLYAAGTLSVKANIAFLAGRLPGRRPPPTIARFNASPRDPFYTLTTLLRVAKNGTMGVWWYALFDYGSTYQCGLFPKDASNPRPTANALQALCAICADHGSDLRTFTPGRLDVEVSGLTAATDWDCYQASNGRFLLPLWHAAEDVGQGTAVPVTLRFATPKRITVFEPLTGMAEVANSENVREITVNLPPGVVVLEVTV